MIATKSVIQPYSLTKSMYTALWKTTAKQSTNLHTQSIKQYSKLAKPYISANQQAKVSMTLFSKDNCQLCDKALYILDEIYAKKPEYKEIVNLEIIDINNPLNKEWWDKYCFDVPVLHISEANTSEASISDSISESSTSKESNSNNKENSSDVDITKIFHKLDENDVISKINRLI
ncbi:hypothetical protein ACO0QE_000491 [Hanseniaspora vineae]